MRILIFLFCVFLGMSAQAPGVAGTGNTLLSALQEEPGMQDHHNHDGHDYSGNAHGVQNAHADHGPIADLSYAWVIPFALLLLCIAILPLVAEHWWESNANKAKISIPLGLFVAGYLGFNYGHKGFMLIEHSFIEYVQFIILLASLYIISGGIVISGKMVGTPKFNTTLLAIGAVIASFVGTTGASMLLIRPILRANAIRRHVAHTVIFFIFAVSNIGGCLTPLGDPPLFLGFLKGVPFRWTFTLWPEWLLMNVILLTLYFFWDSSFFKKPGEFLSQPEVGGEGISVDGKINFFWLFGVVLSVAFLTPDFLQKLGLHPMMREVVMLVLIALSLNLTPKKLRLANEFNYHPIAEVAVLFVGIFLTMIPAINTLKLIGPKLGVSTPAQFFWGAGLLSSFLDNAPTYVVFYELAGTLGFAPAKYGAIVANGVPADILAAISLGSVFMGANSYIGNGPNFMVKAIAEQSGVKMPSFFGYMAYSFGILVPLFGVITLIFFI